ncbi:ClC family H(+)/Cl(-) exchange transporter [Clostridium sp. SHJSY1]|uniref:ClC family H(+)/Cl(-) exchange transporter n=1 Tax=Clostridium sp. SHJSY1 TaxID=2942483 RepID=UPI002875097D|nr:ClC family H(+)/Cl(-) exchange transporter [Clostridium sp. SHJSY1]MDS0525211.1 ClC family H(+)/Cl(-) exchange transporter [Clostridium sp. SHJSY1]
MVNNFDIITNGNTSKLKLVLKALLVGVMTSFVAILYRFALSYAEELSLFFYSFEKNHKWTIPLGFIFLALIGWIVGKIVEKEPFSGGSGIPQVKGIMGGYLTNRPISSIVYKFLGGVLAIVSGLSLGREGPSVQLGACTGDFVSKKFKSTRLERRLLMSSGASAGLAAAFNAPLSGVLFSLEEIYKYFSPLVLLSTITAAVASDFIAKEFFGLQPVFKFGKTTPIPLSNYWLLIILGIILGLGGAFYNWITLKCQYIYGKIKLNMPIKMIFPFIIAGILGLIFPVVLCGGHVVINNLTLNSTLGLLVLILILKFLFSIISFGSGAPGGIFFPLLIIGGVIGAIFGYIVINYFGVSAEFFNNFIIISMAGYFTAIVRAPITGIILITEMTSSLQHLLSLTIVSIIAYIVAEALRSKPIYDSLLESLLKKNNINNYHKNSEKKIVIATLIHFGSQADNKTVKDIDLPQNALIISVKRGQSSLVPNGNTILKAGDELLTMTDLSNEWKVRESLDVLATVE